MRASLVLGAGRGPRLAVLESIKRHPEGRSVRDLGKDLGMSYMGVKAHCIALVAEGFVVTRREPSTKGRPRMLHRLAPRGEELFAAEGGDLALSLLREASGLFGPTAPMKLLTMYFRSLAARYRDRLGASSSEVRIRAFVSLREREGRISSFRETPPCSIDECHNPLSALMTEYPGAALLEENMVSEVLALPVRRVEEGSRVVFRIS